MFRASSPLPPHAGCLQRGRLRFTKLGLGRREAEALGAGKEGVGCVVGSNPSHVTWWLPAIQFLSL